MFARIRDDQIGRVRGWLTELPERRRQAEETYEREGTRAERAYLLDTSNGAVLVYIMEVEDLERAYAAFDSSTLPIDLELKALMSEAVEAPLDPELLYAYP